MTVRQFILLSVVLLQATGCATTQTASQLTPHIQTTTLDNGLTVYLLEDHSAPIATFQYWVKVGSADEREGTPGITGLSHFFEHMMFRGTEKYPDYFRAVSSKGAQLNAFTWLDVTVYWEKFASQHLDFILDIEANRLANMTIDLLNLEPEREVVKSERLLRTENSASGALGEAVGATVYQKHSYHWPTVGWMRDLNEITIEEARAYHGRFYVPNNAYVILVGDFDSTEAIDKVQAYFGDFPRGTIDRPNRIPEPPQTRVRRTWVAKPTATGLLNVSYRSPAGGDPDFVILEVIDAILTKGRNTRIQKALVYGENPVAKSVSPFLFPFRDPGVFQLELDLLPGISNVTAEHRLEKTIAALRTTPVDESELKRAVAQLRADIVRRMTTTQSRAQLMGFSVRATGDPTMPWKRLTQYGDVTPEDIMRVAKEWLQPERRVIGNAVNVSHLVTLASKTVKAWPKGSAADSMLIDATKLAVTRYQLQQERAAASMEKQAIKKLQERASRELLTVETQEQRELIKKYLQTADQGPVKRTAALRGREQRLEKAEAHLAEQAKEIQKRASELAGTDRNRFAVGLTMGTLPKPPETAAGEQNNDIIAEWALASLCHSISHTEPPPQDLLSILDERKGSHPVLGALFEFAHTVQRVDAGRL
jgi:zinc protease